MKFTLSWLHDHLETEADLKTITDTLTAIGLEVESSHDPAAALSVFCVGHVVDASQHPNADRLRVCHVDTGNGVTKVICGAPNARTGMKGVFAPAGSTIPGTGLHLRKSKIRGVESNGMLCSERELGISDEHEGIIDLPDDAVIGAPAADILGLNDPVIEIAITPNRQDCLGVRGIARDLAAAGLGRLKDLDATIIPGQFDSPVGVTLQFDAATKKACPCFVGRYFRNLENRPSPDWLQRRLNAIGLRPISALVDVTNYVSYDLGRPLHVFDADKLNGDIHARLGRDGEQLSALNDKVYAIDDTMTVIADDAGPQGLGGVMGGLDSGCTEETKNMFLEVALFDPVRTAATGRKLQLESDARYRFERGVDQAMVLPGAEIATRMIQAFCGGEVSNLVIAGSADVDDKVVALRPGRVAALAGIDVAEDKQKQILSALGFSVDDSQTPWQVTAPTWRCDIDGEADLVEEVARIVGLDEIPAVPLPPLQVVAQPAWSPGQRRAPIAKRLLADRGLTECVTWSFQARQVAEMFGGGATALTLVNPISSELDVMRPSLLGNLLLAAARNQARGFHDLALFEVGPQYEDDSIEGQARVAGGLRIGHDTLRHWAHAARAVDVFDAKADAQAVLEAIGAAAGKTQINKGGPGWYHPGRVGTLMLGPKRRLAFFGEIHPAILTALEVTGPAVGFEVFLDEVPLPKKQSGRHRAALNVSGLQSVERDFAFIVSEDVAAADLVRAVLGVEKRLIQDVQIFDLYQGEHIEAGHKSVALSVRLQPFEQTLTDAEIDAVASKVVTAAEKAVGARLRGG